MHLLVEFHKNYNCFLPPTVLVIHKVPLEVIPRYPPKGLSTYRVLLQYPHSRTPPFYNTAFIILLIPRGIVIGVVGVVNIVINFLPVASEMIKLLILLATSSISSNTTSTASSITASTASTAGTANFTFIKK